MEPKPRQLQSGKSGKIFLGLFVGIGIIVLLFGLKMLLVKRSSDAVGLLITGAIFMVIPLLIMYSLSRQQKQAAVTSQKQNSDPTPWLRREEWAKREIVAKEGAPPFVLFIAAAGAVAVAVGFEFFGFGSFSKGLSDSLFDWLSVIVIGIPAVIMVVMGCRAMARHKNFGKSVFKMSSETGVIGGKLEGSIVGESRVEQPGRFTVRLICYQQIGGGEDSKISELWEQSQSVSTASGPGNFIIPVSIPIPANCEETDAASPDNLVIWRLEASAKVPGVNYQARFEVPVFKPRRNPPGSIAGHVSPVQV